MNEKWLGGYELYSYSNVVAYRTLETVRKSNINKSSFRSISSAAHKSSVLNYGHGSRGVSANRRRLSVTTTLLTGTCSSELSSEDVSGAGTFATPVGRFVLCRGFFANKKKAKRRYDTETHSGPNT